MGTAYVARIKDPKNSLSIHKKPDFLHAIAYDDPKEPFDYMQLKSLVEVKNKLILYSYTISRARWYYLMGTTTCIPSFWLLSRILEKLTFYLDLGALTSGPAFHFEKKEGKKRCWT